MSQFHFPRINFWGKAFINPSTANNNFFAPLVHYDPVQVKAIIPPRIYLTKELKRLYQLGGLPLPAKQPLQITAKGDEYIEIASISTKSAYQTWLTSPLGSCKLDSAYHELYDLVRIQRTNESIKGGTPAFWNYYGGHEFGFKDVRVGSIEMLQEGRPVLFHKNSKERLPASIDFLGARLDTRTQDGKNAATIVDVVPSRSLYSQIFCDSLIMQKGERILMAGKPHKASLRFLNTHRITNVNPLLSSSGYFFTAIPLEELEGGTDSPIFQLFQHFHSGQGVLQGLFIRYNLFELIEDYSPDYAQLGTRANPAWASLAGSISPWYSGEMKSIGVGRQLISDAPFLAEKTLPPTIYQIDASRETLTIDMLGTLPEIHSQEKKEQQFETYNLGELKFLWKTRENKAFELGHLLVDEQNLSRQSILLKSGMYEFDLSQNDLLGEANWEEGSLEIYGEIPTPHSSSTDILPLLKESDYLVVSDQAGIYAEQAEGKVNMFRSYSSTKEACFIRVFSKGKPFKNGIPMTVMEWKNLDPFGPPSTTVLFQEDNFLDGHQLTLAVDQPCNAMYVFFPGQNARKENMLLRSILHKGFFINLRVLPNHDYGKYLDPNHPAFPTPVTFEVIYQEILENYDLIYPQASIITPFTEEYFNKGKSFIKSRMSPSNWHSYAYMPSTREMSQDQWDLFCKWFENA
ncbi:MAG: hypothetical protein AAFY71_11420 [Bacteroidota bacterium]